MFGKMYGLARPDCKGWTSLWTPPPQHNHRKNQTTLLIVVCLANTHVVWNLTTSLVPDSSILEVLVPGQRETYPN